MKHTVFALIAAVLVALPLAACQPAAASTGVAQAPRQGSQPKNPPPAYELPRPQATQAPWPEEPQPGSESGANPQTSPRIDHLSTFAVDVDTASYTQARTILEQGYLPDPGSVRVEEFVNYFKQDYPAPHDIAFGIYADSAPSPFHSDGTYFLRVGVQGYRVPDAERKPMALTLVLDISGSMADRNKLELLKDSLALLVERLRPEDTVGIVVYTTTARVELDPVSGRDKRRIMSVINHLNPEATTNVEDGLQLGFALASNTYREDANNRIILCSDGVANTGSTTWEAILASVSDYARRGIMLNTVGVGMGDYNDNLLEQLADNGDGVYTYINDVDEAERLFVDQLTASMQTIALNAKVQVDFNTDVVSDYRLIGYENRAVADQDFRDDTVDAGEIGAGHSVTALYALRLRPETQGRIATIQMRWEDPDTNQIQEINGNFNTWDITPSFRQASPRFRLSSLAAQTAEVLRSSPYAENLRLDDIYAWVNDLARGPLSEDADVREFANMVDQARYLLGE